MPAPEAPSSPPPPPSSQAPAHVPPADALETYHTLAETVGGVPNLRWKDNLYQTIFILAFTLIAAVVGYAMGGLLPGLLLGTFAGLVVSFLISGTVLMILGWVRTARKMRSR